MGRPAGAEGDTLKLKAAVLESIHSLLVMREVQLASPGPFEVLVRTVAVSLCHSDLHFMEGTRTVPLPAILGHEAAGVVEAVGRDVTDLAPGDHVVGALGVYCGTCARCLAGRLTLCSDTSVKQPPGQARRISMGGRPVAQVYNLSAFAEAFLTHRNALVKIPREIPPDRAALLGCGVATGTGAVFRTASVQPGDDVVVIGVGGVGLAAINGARIAGAHRIVAVDRLATKLEMARSFGATHGIDASRENVVERVHEITGGGADHALSSAWASPRRCSRPPVRSSLRASRRWWVCSRPHCRCRSRPTSSWPRSSCAARCSAPRAYPWTSRGLPGCTSTASCFSTR